MGLNNHLIDGG